MRVNRFGFRAWDGNRMTTSGIQFNSSTGKLEFKPAGVLMQSVGITDENDIEIFEGDIVDGWCYEHTGKFLVFFDEGAFSIHVTDEYSPCLYESFPEDNLTIIGNVHENPELLK